MQTMARKPITIARLPAAVAVLTFSCLCIQDADDNKWYRQDQDTTPGMETGDSTTASEINSVNSEVGTFNSLTISQYFTELWIFIYY